MGTAKKERKREKEPKKDGNTPHSAAGASLGPHSRACVPPVTDSDDDDDDDDEVEEEEEVESVHAKRKKEKSRKAFMSLCRQLLAFIPLGMILSQQPLMMKPRQPGVNRAKLVPLQLAVSGVMDWAKSSPTTIRNPDLNGYINVTARALLTPYEWGKAQSSKRAMPNEKTFAGVHPHPDGRAAIAHACVTVPCMHLAGAYKKTKGALERVAKGDSAMHELKRAPFPNLPVIGSYLMSGCSLLAVRASHACREVGWPPRAQMAAWAVVSHSAPHRPPPSCKHSVAGADCRGGVRRCHRRWPCAAGPPPPLPRIPKRSTPSTRAPLSHSQAIHPSLPCSRRPARSGALLYLATYPGSSANLPLDPLL